MRSGSPPVVPARALAVAVLATSVLAGCSGGAVSPPDPPAATDRAAPASDPAPDGALRVAYPYDPWTLVPFGTDDLAATDLAALWGLPLLRLDAGGQLRPALVDGVTVTDEHDHRAVRLSLREGEWSDGSDVTATDVVATVELQRALPRTAPAWEGLRSVGVEGGDVVLELEPGHGRWPWMLASLPSVLPADVATVEALDAAVADPALGPGTDTWPIGGAFVPVAQVDGLSVSFDAHPGSPLGPPRTAALEVLVVPSVDLALGLLDRDEVDLAVGHLALRPLERLDDLEDVTAAAPSGGTLAELAWDGEGAVGGDPTRRAAVAAVLDLAPFAEGLLGDEDAVLGGTGPDGDRGGQPGDERAGADLTDLAAEVTVPRGQEAVVFAARAAQRAVEQAGGTLSVAAVEPVVASRAEPGPGTRPADDDGRDGRFRVRRAPPWQDLRGRLLTDDEAATELAAAYDLGARPGPDGVQPLVDDGALPTPLVRLPVLHAWDADVAGVAPSAWPGIGLASAADWRADADG